MLRPTVDNTLGSGTNCSLMQRQLALLLHAAKCRDSDANSTPCTIKHCCVMKQVLIHIEKCMHDGGCNETYCRSSKLVLQHFHSCKEKACEVCCAVRKPALNTKSEPTSLNDYRNGPASLNNSKPDIVTMNGIKGSPNLDSAITSSCSSTSTIVNGDTNRHGNANNFYLSDQLRESAMKKFVTVSLSCFPNPNFSAYSDPRMKQFLDHVKRIEKDIYMKSKSATEYYAALTNCYHNIHHELKEKHRLRGTQPSDTGTTQTDLPLTTSETPSASLADCSASNCTVAPNSVQERVPSQSPAVATEEEPIKPESVKGLSGVSSVTAPSIEAPKIENEPSEGITKTDSPTTVGSTAEQERTTPNSPSTTIPKEEKSTDSSDVKTGSATTTSHPREPSNRMVWYPNELQRYFLPIVDKISKEKDAEPFLQPVDWEALEIFDYPQVVSHPMDLSTIRKKLENREYKEPWNVVDDVWLMLNNAWSYNKKTSKVYKTCTRLGEIFEVAIDPIMQQLGFCCGREYYYQPPPLTCLTPKFCTIQRDAIYYVYKNEYVFRLNSKHTFSHRDQTPGLLEQKYPVCERCYNEAGDEVRLDSDSSTVVTVPKTQMEKSKNDRREKEVFVFCRKCGRKWHRVCAIHMDEIWSEGFVCKRCMKDHSLKRSENRFTARKLSTCKLSNFLEKRVNDFLKKKCINTGDVIIRVLAAADKTVDVKPGMKSRFCESGEMPESFPYRVKAIFAFQEIDGQEVCFFGLHVQEFGSECPYPNTRRVYLAYLDSVYFFRPKQYRTDIYHELLIGYIQYAKWLGFTMAHIWACPPSEGDDYIFHMHPPDQKIPKPKRLQEWYQKMLKKSLHEHIVVDYKDICQDALESGFISPTELAYFEGDFWPNTLEELIKEMDEQDAIRKREQEALARDDDDDEAKDNPQTRDNEKNPGKKKNKKRKLKRNTSLSSSGKRKRMNAPGGTDLAEEVAHRVYEIMEKHKENFFVIRLYPQNTVASLPPIKDPDPLVGSDLMECRGAFLERAREKHLEFSSVRRAKFSTLAMLYELHTENRQPLMYTCNVCSIQLETPWHCRQCVEYDLCQRCYETERHQHPMVQVGLGLVDGSKTGQDVDSEAAAVQESGRDKLSRLVKALSHGCSCRDANCRVYACKAMKSNVQHFRNHASTGRNKCSVCRSLSFLCLYHSKTCIELKCPVPLCPKLKAKMKQQQKQQRLEQTQMLRRRMATMQRYNSVTPNHQPNPPSIPPQGQSAADGVSSPAPTSMQASPATTPNHTTVPFTTMTSPSRTSISSLPSPSPQTQFMHPLSNPNQLLIHSKQATPNSTALSSPPQASPQQAGASGPSSHPSISVGSYGVGSSNNVMMSTSNQPYMDTGELARPDATVANTYPHPSLSRSQSVVATTGSMSFPSVPRPQQMERSQSAQFMSANMNPVHTNHGQLMRQSPGLTAQYNSNNAPLSPRYIQPPLQQQQQSYPNTNQETLAYTQIAASMGPRMSMDQSNHSSYPQVKHPPVYAQHAVSSQQQQPRHSSQLIQSTMEQQQQQHGVPVASVPHTTTHFSGNSNWRSPAPTMAGMNCSVPSIYTGHQQLPMMTHASLQHQQQQIRGTTSGNSCAPNVTVARSAAAPIPSGHGGCVTPPIGVSAEDVHVVKQAYNEMRQRGLPTSEFSNWLNANPHLMRAWQFIQPSLIYAPQQQQQQQQAQMIMPISHSTGPPHMNNVPTQQQLPVSFPSGQVPAPVSRSLRHSSHPQPSAIQIPGQQQQQWTPMPSSHQTRFRPTSVSPTQHQFAYYPQSNKFAGINPSPAMLQQTQQPLNPQPRYMNQLTGAQSVHPSGSLPMSPSSMMGGNMPRATGTGGMLSQGSQLPPHFVRSGGGTMTATGAGGPGSSSATMAISTSSGVANPMMCGRSSQPAPQYSSAMLSQLLGPGQPTNGANGQPINPTHFSLHPNALNQTPNYNQPPGGVVVTRADFMPQPQSNALGPHYPDNGSMQ